MQSPQCNQLQCACRNGLSVTLLEWPTLPIKYCHTCKRCRLTKFLIARINWTDTTESRVATMAWTKSRAVPPHSISPYCFLVAEPQSALSSRQMRLVGSRPRRLFLKIKLTKVSLLRDGDLRSPTGQRKDFLSRTGGGAGTRMPRCDQGTGGGRMSRVGYLNRLYRRMT